MLMQRMAGLRQAARQWPRTLRWSVGLACLLAMGLTVLLNGYDVSSAADSADGVPGAHQSLRAALWLDGGSDADGADLARPPAAATLTARGRLVRLPHRLDPHIDAARVNWFQLPLRLAAGAPDTAPQAICVPRWSASASVWLDGQRLAASAPGLGGMYDFSRPQFVSLPPGLAAGEHRLTLGVRARPGLSPGLSEIWLGDGPLMRHACESLAETRHERVYGAALLIGMMGMVGLLIAVLLRDVSGGYFALMALMWIVQHFIALWPWPGVDERTWTLLFMATRTAFVPPMCIFCLRFAKVHRRWLECALTLAYVGAVLALPLLAPAQLATWLGAVSASLLAVTMYFLAVLVRHVLRESSYSGSILVAAVAFVVMAGLMDMARLAGLAPFGGASLSILAMPLMSMAFGALLIERLVRSTREQMHAAETLRETVAGQAAKLTGAFETLKAQGERLVVLEERRRIARDMHDGVGSHLVSVSAMLKATQPMSQVHVAGLVDAALHELRGVLDVLSAQPATHPEDDPVSTLLGSLRWRIGPVLESQGITLDWQADTLPADYLPSDAARLQLLRLLQETFANIVKHARARVVQFRSHAKDGAIWIEISDDGLGVAHSHDGHPDPGLGLAGMRSRADLLGAELTIADTNPGTRVSLRFPWPLKA
ncbi:MAG: ATP-binding protein [Massilia sp.]